MRLSIAFLSCVVLCACGGGGGAADVAAPAPLPTASPPAIRFEAFSQLSAPTATRRALIVRPVSGDATIATNPVARVQLQTNEEAPVALTAANGTDALGRPQYVFTVPEYAAEFQFRNCTTWLPMRITVADANGFAFSKYTTFCPGQEFSLGGFSDYGERRTRYVGSATAPVTASASRVGQGGYTDSFVARGATAFDRELPAREGDVLSMAMLAPSATAVPAGTILVARAEGEGGAFAESTVSTTASQSSASVVLGCCRPVASPAGSAANPARLRLQFIGSMFGVPNAGPATYRYTWRVTDSATGAVVSQDGGDAADFASFTLDAKAGQQVSVDARPTVAGGSVTISLSNATGLADNALTGPALGEAASNRLDAAARVNVYCCAR